MKIDVRRMVLTTMVVCFLAACAAKPGSKAPPGLDTRPVDLARGRGVAVLTGAGQPVTWAALIEACANADAVVVGENHGHDLGLTFAAAVWHDVAAKAEHSALALEFFERDEQSRLDDYLAGLGDEKAFTTRTGRTASNYPPGHRAMVERAKELGRPVIAANAPRPYVRLVRQQGYGALDRLTPEQARLVRIPDELLGGRYREAFEALMRPGVEQGHGGTPPTPDEIATRLEGFYRSQQTWDWTMGESVVRALEVGRRPVLLVIGRFHSDFEGGTVQVIRRLRPGVRAITISMIDANADGLRVEDRGRGDFVVYVGSNEPRP
ncbi:MAG: hypothetical protein HBSAPP03_08150 [Phycisphaerae bacterium]|nr:MAG: hypothetical protein HBSAPP03_08150 [Phycisphaerae bacterium]